LQLNTSLRLAKSYLTIKQVYNNSCIGYNIRGKFKSLTSLRASLELIPENEYAYALKALGGL